MRAPPPLRAIQKPELESLLRAFREPRRNEEATLRAIARRLERLKPAFSWASLYELPFHLHLALALQLFDLSDEVIAISRLERPVEGVASLLADIETREPPGGDAAADGALTDEDELLLLGTWLSCYHNLRSFSVFSRSLNHLVAKTREGDVAALCNAVRIDPVVLGAPSVSALLARWHLQDSEGAMKALQAALNGPNQKRSTYPELRITREVLQESGALRESRESIYSLVVEQLGLYDHRHADALKALFSNFSAWRKESTS